MTSRSFQDQHRDWLTALASPATLQGVLEAAADRSGWDIPMVGWDIVWGRLFDAEARRARLMCRSNGDRFDVVTVDVGDPEGDFDGDLGPVSVTRFPQDRGLPTLPQVLDNHPEAELVRYRPGKRCTFRIPGLDPQFVKVFATGDVAQIHADGANIWDASCCGELAFAVAKSLGYDQTTATHIQAEVPGRPVTDDLYGPSGESRAWRIGWACASIPKSSISPNKHLDAATELLRTHRRAAEVLTFVPGLAPEVDEFLTAIGQLHHNFAIVAPHPIHGSPHPTQWLSDDDQLGLVDFDRLSWGDPELDVATFAAEVDFEAIDNANELNESFVDGYQCHYGQLDRHRLTAYRGHKGFAKVYRTIRSLRPDADHRAVAHLDRAIETVKHGAAP